AAAFRLRPVEGEVGILHEIREVLVARLQEGDTGARGDRDALRLDRERRIEGMQQARREHPGGGGVTIAPDQSELVTAEPRHGAAVVLEGRETLTDRHQNLVA